jgi:uncharacterized MAPEG superfamily protein
MDSLIAASALMLVVYLWTMMACGRARATYGVAAPATTGHPLFERAYRVQINTVEQLLPTLPAVWLLGVSVSYQWATVAAVAWSVGRIWYALAYQQNPDKRGPGFLIGFVATVASILVGGGTALYRLIVG